MSPVVERARARVREAGGAELLERLEHLDAMRSERILVHLAPAPPKGEDGFDVDVAIAGGGLWSLLAPVLARRGLRVAVVERARAAQAHREWNASGPELEALVRSGLLDADALGSLVVARYDRSICRFHGGGQYPVTGVLDHAVDASRLLAHGRRAAERDGVVFLDGHHVLAHASSDHGVRIRAKSHAGEATLTARVLVDARGAASPHATADLVCPTVGGVLAGLVEGDAPDEMNPRVGEILATVDAIEDRRQHLWEAFPGRRGETTVYLFYYALGLHRVSLAELYARFFETLGTYKRGAATLLRPTFGFIPGWSRLSPPPSCADPRVVLVGDAAARHSPLTYCGFGAMLRSLEGVAAEVERRARDAVGVRANAVDDAPIHALTGALARLMASRAFAGGELNTLLDASFRTLHEMDQDIYAALLRDEMTPADFLVFLRRTAGRHPAVWSHVIRGMGPGKAARWALGVARSTWGARA